MSFPQASLFDDVDPKSTEQRLHKNAVALFALASIRGVGFATIKALCDETRGDLTQVFRMDEATLSAFLYDARTPNPSAVVSEIRSNSKGLVSEGRAKWKKYQDKGVKLLFRGEPGYPDALLELASPPSWLFVEGDATLLTSPYLVGFVGTRSPSPQGEYIARRTASCLALMGSVILSGLAEGIDAVGHQTALLYGSPTVAILGHGIDVVFPASTAKVRQDLVLFGGAVVSEYLPTDSYSKDKFVHRNRIQAGLSRAVCFVEARERSGTAHTLRFAKHLNRPLFGVTMNGLRGVQEEELLHVLLQQGGEIFDVANETGIDELHQFLHKAFVQTSSIASDDAPKMFRNILREVRRLADEYGATKRDIEWLRKELAKIQVLGDDALATASVSPKKRRKKLANQDSNPG